MQSRSMFVNIGKYYTNQLWCKKCISKTTWPNELNEYLSNYLENIPIKFTSYVSADKNYLIINFTIKAMLLLHIVLRVNNNSVSIKLYQTDVNIWIEILEKKLDITRAKFKRILRRVDYQQDERDARKSLELYINLFFDLLSRVTDNGCWLLLTYSSS